MMHDDTSTMMHDNTSTMMDDNTSTVPFYLKQSETNSDQVIAVVYYGEVGDRSKEIEVPCTMDTTMNHNMYVGPESIICTCETLSQGGCSSSYCTHNTNMINNSKCELHVPFHFDYDMNGTITSVSFDKYKNTNGGNNDILIVPFYPQKDQNGNIAAVSVSNQEQNPSSSSSSSSPSPVSIVLFALLVTGIVIVIVASSVYIKRMWCKRPKPSTPNNTTTTTIDPIDEKNTADLEDPPLSQPSRNHHRDHNDDDTATESISDYH
jgi:hypothetical protein